MINMYCPHIKVPTTNLNMSSIRGVPLIVVTPIFVLFLHYYTVIVDQNQIPFLSVIPFFVIYIDIMKSKT